LILENIGQKQEKFQEKLVIEKEAKKTQPTKIEIKQSLTGKDKVVHISSASPKVRKFARELGVDINQVTGSEREGRVIESDIKLFVASRSNNSVNNKNENNEKIKQEYPHSEFGKIEIKDIPRVKKLSSKYLMNSWTNIPHVTNHDEADITELEEFRTSLTDIYTGEKKKITPLAFIVKALTASLKKFPNFNSSIDEIEGGKMTIKKYYHIGIAVDTLHGLMVPKLRNADNKNINLINSELKKLSDQCRNLKIDKKELFGGSMTITSLGGIGGSFFTPIINYPEVAILGVGKSEKKQIFLDGKFVTRTMLPLSLSYDHRIIDGAEAARFNNELKENLGKNFAYKLAI
jgi:pyruvate dehydrogenase E2 component (dihydrolipoamide acetyltransferase)